MLNGFLVCGLTTLSQFRLFLLPYTHEIIRGVVLGDIYWIVPCAYPIPKFFVVEFASIVFPNASIRRVAINNVTFFMLIVVVVK